MAVGEPLFVLEHAREDADLAEAVQGVVNSGNLLADLEKGKRPNGQITHSITREIGFLQ